jgi:hypothetical protein
MNRKYGNRTATSRLGTARNRQAGGRVERRASLNETEFSIDTHPIFRYYINS